MKVIYKQPSETHAYYRWFDNNGTFDIWYKKTTPIVDYKNMDIPLELKNFLNQWTIKIAQYKESYRELYPVKLAKIEFIYKDMIYTIFPTTINATYTTTFMSDTPYEVSWDSLFETYELDIRKDMENELNIKHSRYSGFLG